MPAPPLDLVDKGWSGRIIGAFQDGCLTRNEIRSVLNLPLIHSEGEGQTIRERYTLYPAPPMWLMLTLAIVIFGAAGWAISLFI
jgi:hypothetical protein